jgi:sulfatase modifying factor 1
MPNSEYIDGSEPNHSAKETRRPIGASTILVALAGVLGIATVIGNGMLLAGRVFRNDGTNWNDVPWRFRIWEIELRLVAMAAGVVFIVAAFRFARGLWKGGLILTAIAVLAAVANSPMNTALRSHFAGNNYSVDTPTGHVRVVVGGLRGADPGRSPPESLKAPFDLATAGAKQDEWASYLHRQASERNSIGMELVLIPAGTSPLGSSESLSELEKALPIIGINKNDPAYKDSIASEWPLREARIGVAFFMGRCNVTLGQFRAFVNETGYKTDAERDGKGGWGYSPSANPPCVQKTDFNWHSTGFPQQDDCPVINVSWNDAIAFCSWLSKKEQDSYRLPTDAEWEYACRAGTTTRYSVGDDADKLIDSANVPDIAYFTKLLGTEITPEAIDRGRTLGIMVNGNDGYAFTSPVCKFKPNAFGLCDMHGNASTWCMDWYVGDYDVYSESKNNSPLHPSRLVRGGNWQMFPAFCRSASRFSYSVSSSQLHIGFRVVRDLARD